MTIATVGIDLAKNVFAVHAVGKSGLVELKRPEVRRAKLLELVASWPPCLIGMETCSGAHHWAREFEKLGHTVRLMAPKFVAPYRRQASAARTTPTMPRPFAKRWHVLPCDSFRSRRSISKPSCSCTVLARALSRNEQH